MKYIIIYLIIILTVFVSILPAQDYPTVTVFYYSKTGHTRAMAEAVKRGAESIDSVNVKIISVEEAKTNEVLEAEALIVGTPVYNANIAPPVQQFINNWPFSGSPMRDKIGAAFVSAGGFSAGEELVQLNILQAMLINGMIVVGGPNWQGAFGASAITEEEPFKKEKMDGTVDPYFLDKAEALGKRVAALVKRLGK
jgi:NAD(P)H dehydrogenase (quinone)